jgi:Protein of unknown function (DUF2735)
MVMTTDFSRPSAKIYAFPVGGRRFVAAARNDSRTGADPRTRVLSGDAIGEAWYHEAAIEEAKRTGEH